MYEFIAKNTGVTIHVNSYFLRNISRFDQQYGMVAEIRLARSMCWSPNWNEPHTATGTPRFGTLTNPYPNRFGESLFQYGDCFFGVFFRSRTRSAFSHQKLRQSGLRCCRCHCRCHHYCCYCCLRCHCLYFVVVSSSLLAMSSSISFVSLLRRRPRSQ
jgi:hypothetical protein